MEVYTPNTCVDHAALEIKHGCPGKYTKGLMQKHAAITGPDEDAVSMALNAVQRLLERHNVDLSSIGYLGVGTESSVDRSKSIKSFLLRLFPDNEGLEGLDTTNACYGGTAAFFHCVDWVRALPTSATRRFGIVVMADACVTSQEDVNNGFNIAFSGASSVAMLVGPDAPVELLERSTWGADLYDFAKPLGTHAAFVDGKGSIGCYLEGLKHTYQRLRRQCGVPEGLIHAHDATVLHCSSTYLTKRGFKELCNLDLDAHSKSDYDALFAAKVEAGTLCVRELGMLYTASCYVGLHSTLETMSGKGDILVYSYGSGAVASMYRLRVHRAPSLRALLPRLGSRVVLDCDECVRRSEAHNALFGARDVTIEPSSELGDGCWHLHTIDAQGRRRYRRQTS